MNYAQLIKSIVVIFVLCSFCALTIFAQSKKTFQDTRRLLSEMNDVKNDSDKLAKLFQVGDERIEDLLKALDDPDPDISLRAQIAIRYLGSDTGVKRLFEWYDKQKQFRVSGPVPLPLREWDYKSIYANNYIEWFRAEPYIYALALDESSQSATVLKELIKHAGNLEEASVANRAIKSVQTGQPTKVLTGEKGLAKLVLNNAFFVSPDDRKYTSARLLAMNGAKDKGLLEVYINRGVLSEEWYHVVVQKCEQGWRFFSITQVAVS